MQEKLQELKKQAQIELEKVADEVSLQNLKAKFVGRKGGITEIVKSMKDVLPQDRPKMGKLINEVKTFVETLFEEKSNQIKEDKKKRAIAEEKVDVTLPGRSVSVGAKHPVSQVMEEITTIFEKMGFEVAEGPEVETDYYNFEALNIQRTIRHETCRILFISQMM